METVYSGFMHFLGIPYIRISKKYFKGFLPFIDNYCQIILNSVQSIEDSRQSVSQTRTGKVERSPMSYVIWQTKLTPKLIKKRKYS